MTRTITPAEIKPGMTIRWGYGDISYQCPLASVKRIKDAGDMQVETPQGRAVLIFGDTDVLVVKEPQPEEPTEFGAKVRVRDGRFVRLDWVDSRSRPWHEKGTGYRWSWDDLCEMGPVTVIPDQGWTVPETPEVPERIEVWPEDDEALRAYRWRDCYKNVLDWNKTRWRKTTPSGYSFPVDAAFEIDVPCTRVADA